MNHIASHSRLPYFKINLKSHYSGELLGLDVKRRTYQVYYHRTNRSLKDFFTTKEPILNPFFKNSTGFIQYLKNKTVLDLGCSNGALVHELRKQSVSIFGLDLYLKPEQTNSPYFVHGDAFQLPLPEQEFDFIFSSWSVFSYEPASQISKLLFQAYRSLKPQGELFLVGIENPETIQEILLASRKLNMRVYQYSGSSVIRCIRNPS